MFKDILSFTKVRYHTFAEILVPQMIERSLAEPPLRDEMFAQLIKQTTHCPNLYVEAMLF